MKWKDKYWGYCLWFLLGVLVCYISLQYTFFDIKKELDIPSLVISGISLLIGLYIADTLQKRVNKNQNKHTYLVTKLDNLWMEFNDFSEDLAYSTKVRAESLRKFNQEIVYPVSFLKSIFNSFEVDETCVCDLELKLEELESKLSNIPAKNNVVDFGDIKPEVDEMILKINTCFSSILKVIQEV
jgi:hypothetical protein